MSKPILKWIRKSSEYHHASASHSPPGRDHNGCGRSGLSSTVRRQCSGVHAEVAVGRFQLHYVPVCFVGRMSSDRCGPFRDVPAEPLCATAVSSRAQSAFPINSVAAAAVAFERHGARAKACQRSLADTRDCMAMPAKGHFRTHASQQIAPRCAARQRRRHGEAVGVLRLMINSAFAACCCLMMEHPLAVPSLHSIQLRT